MRFEVGFERPRVLSWPIWIASLSIRSWVLIAFTTSRLPPPPGARKRAGQIPRPWRDAAEFENACRTMACCAWRRTPDCRCQGSRKLAEPCRVDGDDRSELHTEADRDLDRLPGDCDTGKAMLTISKVTGFQKPMPW